MARVHLDMTRRQFLATGLASAALVGPSRNLLARSYPDPPWFATGDVVTTYNYCDMCPWKCGIVVKSVDGRVIKVDGNPLDPKARGKLFGRGQGGVSFMDDPDRLQAPMIRTGERGEGTFREVTWEEAFDYTAEKLLHEGLEARADIGPDLVECCADPGRCDRPGRHFCDFDAVRRGSAPSSTSVA